MIYAVLFEDNPGLADLRFRHMPDHLSFLERHASSIQAAGPLIDTASKTPAGGLWLVQADSPAAVRKLVESDPFWPIGLRKSVRILEWTQVYSNGKRRI